MFASLSGFFMFRKKVRWLLWFRRCYACFARGPMTCIFLPTRSNASSARSRSFRVSAAETCARKAEAQLQSLAEAATLAQQARAMRNEQASLAKDHGSETRRLEAAQATLDSAGQTREALDAELAHVRAQILALGTEVVEGDAAVVTVGLSERTSVDRKEVAKLLTAEQLASVTRVTQVESLRWKAKLQVAAAA